MLDLSRIEDEAVGAVAITVTLSPESVALFLDTAQWIDERDQWQVGDDEPTDADWDTIQEITAKAQAELMTEASPIVNNPLGVVFPYATTNPPADALACDGATYLRTAYPDLYAILDPAYIVDADHFKTPDLRSRVLIGAGQGAGLSNYAVDASGGEEAHVLTTAQLPAHNHPVTDPGHLHTYTGVQFQANVDQAGSNQGRYIANAGQFTSSTVTGVTVGNTGSGNSHENRQPYRALKFAIWALT